MGLGWALGLFQKGWKIGVRYHEEVSIIPVRSGLDGF